jgi:hypothetical protein
MIFLKFTLFNILIRYLVSLPTPLATYKLLSPFEWEFPVEESESYN